MAKQSEKREDVLNATLALIAEQGFHAAPMSQIAEKAQLGVGTIYRYFKSKEELINALYLEIRKKMAQVILSGQDTSRPVKEQFIQYLQNLIRYLIIHPAEIQFTQQYENSPFITETTRNEVSKIASPISDLFALARNKNLLKDLPDSVLMAIFSGASMGLLKMYLQDKPPVIEMDAAIEAIWDMIAKQGV
jgi:AcrR family transcriptional regulator